MIDNWSPSPFPKRMSVKKADRWLAEHPEVDRLAFWLDQSEKHGKASEKALKWAAILLVIGVVIQMASLALELLS